MSHNVADLVKIFDACFRATENTLLIHGASEPLYLPANVYCPFNRIYSTHNYFSSALHEVSHWCIAGVNRRQQVDYGYWYNPDGRTMQQQIAFECVEVKPQALEYIFSFVSKSRFNVSIDNLSSTMSDTEYEGIQRQFTQKINEQISLYLMHGLPYRAQIFVDALSSHYRGGESINWGHCRLA